MNQTLISFRLVSSLKPTQLPYAQTQQLSALLLRHLLLHNLVHDLQPISLSLTHP
jgi:hypothetical protein